VQVTRETIVRVIAERARVLSESPSARAPVARAEDPVTMRAALEEACRAHGITVDDYTEAVRGDPTLSELERLSLTEAAVGSTDPGPHDAISRESPSGQPGDLTKFRSVPRGEAPGGS
jgi:hypothetical protein